jgi:hypothetical protein
MAKLTRKEMVRRILALPKEQQEDALTLLYLSSGKESEGGANGEITLFVGTEQEITVSVSMLPTLEEWKKGAEAQLRDPSLGPGDGMPEWEARAPARVVEAWKRLCAERIRQVEEVVTMFEDDDETDST